MLVLILWAGSLRAFQLFADPTLNFRNGGRLLADFIVISAATKRRHSSVDIENSVTYDGLNDRVRQSLGHLR
jgi:hypothetical protein